MTSATLSPVIADVPANTATDVRHAGKSRLVHLDYFRAMAIIFVVAAHCTMNWQIDTSIEKATFAVFKGTTPLFVFVSGVFFAVLSKRYAFGDFMIRKSKRLLAPYLFVATSYLVIFGSDNVVDGGLVNGVLPSLPHMAESLIRGTVTYGTWYIPFAMVLFIASPLFIRTVSMSPVKLASIAVVMLGVSSVLHRSDFVTNTLWHNAVYFTPYYVLGIAYAGAREPVDHWLKARALYVVAAFALCTIMLFDKGLERIPVKTDPFMWAGFDPAVLQMPLMIAALLGMCLRWEHRDLPGIRFLAEISFGIFFLHPWVLKFLGTQYAIVDMRGIEAWVLTSIATLTLSAAAVVILKSVLGKRSASFIGA